MLQRVSRAEDALHASYYDRVGDRIDFRRHATVKSLKLNCEVREGSGGLRLFWGKLGHTVHADYNVFPAGLTSNTRSQSTRVSRRRADMRGLSIRFRVLGFGVLEFRGLGV